VGIYGNNNAEDKFVVWTGNDKLAAKYYFYNKKTGDTKFLANAMPWLKEDQMATMKPIEYKSRDGLTIHGYLTLPKDMEPKNIPVVVNPHGGPWGRNSWGFNPEVQLLANRGYGVLQMNFRGSTGYGKEFWLKSRKQWGKTMQDDITDGVLWLIKQGIADPNRVAIYGASYGGYATLAGVTFTPDLYACAVDYVGVSNMFTFMKTIPPYWKPYVAMWNELVGDPVKDSLLLAEVSPALHADKIKTPLFIAQGANDPRVNKAESDQMVEALKKRGVAVEYMVKNDEGHGFANENNQIDFYKAMDNFIAKYLSGKP
jgi:dipeptidyl aminopeptidase/acylaminoacyl peptidase